MMYFIRYNLSLIHIYVGEGKGYKGNIKVEVTVKNNKIAKIEAVEYRCV